MYKKFQLPEVAYTPGGLSILHAVEEKQARAEYSRLRSVARKRIERLGSSEFSNRAIYRYNVNRFIPLQDVRSVGQLGSLLGDVKRFLESPVSTVSGQRADRKSKIAQLHAHNYKFVNESNFDRFTDFMEYIREKSRASQLSSDQVAELFEVFKVGDVDLEQVSKEFSKWIENRAALVKTAREYKKQGRSHISSQKIKEILK